MGARPAAPIAPAHPATFQKARAMHPTHHRFATIDGRQVFYREAGDPAAPTILLLHGFPPAVTCIRDLIPLLADRFHVVAPDYIGFGQSDAPSVDAFDYSFET